MFEITMAGAAKNALGTEMMEFLLDQLRTADGRPVLLTGTGDAFSAGLNLKEVATLEGEAMISFMRLLERCMAALYLYPGPTVALVNGHAIAGGCVLVLCCDFRVIASNPKIKIGLNEAALGVRFPPRILSIVRRRLPTQHLEEVILGGGLFDPENALRIGLVDEIATDAASVARGRLNALASNPAELYSVTKVDLRGTEAGLCPNDEEERFLATSLTSWTSPALRQKIAAMFSR